MTRWRWFILVAIVMMFLVSGAAACSVLTSEYAKTGFPGALQQSENVEVGGTLGLNSAYYASYQTNEPFNDVISWYIDRFDLDSGDAPAHNNCFKLYGSQDRFVATEILVVDVCQTSTRGQLIYVKRFYASNLDEWRN